MKGKLDMFLTLQAHRDVDWICYFHVCLIFQATNVTQQSYQELVLTEDEKRLLAKEGLTLPNQFPLTKVPSVGNYTIIVELSWLSL